MLGSKVVVTTKHRGVFYGELVERDGETVTLWDARNCARWSAETKGFLGLASIGPQEGSNVTPVPAPTLTLYGVTSIAECSEQAVDAWETVGWSE